VIAFVDDHRDVHGVGPICPARSRRPRHLLEGCSDNVGTSGCRSRERRATPTSRAAPLRRRRRRGCAAPPSRVATSAGCGRRTSGSTACARSGGSSAARASRPRAAPFTEIGARPMRETGLEGAVRGRIERTTVSDEATPWPRDRVSRAFRAERPNRLPRASSRRALLRSRMIRLLTDHGSPTSPASRPGRASSTAPSWSTPSPAASSAGGLRPPHRRLAARRENAPPERFLTRLTPQRRDRLRARRPGAGPARPPSRRGRPRSSRRPSVCPGQRCWSV